MGALSVSADVLASAREVAGVAWTVPAVVGDSGRIVVVAPHPDDEVLGCGGLLAMATAAGLPCVIVSVSDGEACYPDHPAWPPQRLRRARALELRRALRELGLWSPRIERLRLPDGDIAGHEATLADALRARLRAGDAVFVTAGFDGHPDHEACARATHAAAGGDTRVFEYPIWAGRFDEAAGVAARMPVALMLPTHVRERKLAAIGRFATQTGSAEAIDDPILTEEILARFAGDSELFFR